MAMKKLKHSGPFLVINGDTFFEVDLTEFLSFHARKKADLTVGLLEVPVNSRYGGVLLGKGGDITAFQLRTSDSDNKLVNGGIYLIEENTLSNTEEAVGCELSLEDQLFPDLLRIGRRIFGFISKGRFIDIGIPDDYHRATMMLHDG